MVKMERIQIQSLELHITKYKMSVPYSTYPNPAVGGTSFMLETLDDIHLLSLFNWYCSAKNKEQNKIFKFLRREE